MSMLLENHSFTPSHFHLPHTHTQCGPDFFKAQQAPPQGIQNEVGERCASFDRDTNRIVYFYESIHMHVHNVVLLVRGSLTLGPIPTLHTNWPQQLTCCVVINSYFGNYILMQA